MSNKANLTELLAESGSSARHKREVIRQPATPANMTAPAQQGRAGTSPITVHFPKQVRDQLKILAVQKNKTLHTRVRTAGAAEEGRHRPVGRTAGAVDRRSLSDVGHGRFS